MLLFNIALKNLRGNLSFTLFFILNLSIGLAGYTLLDGFKTSFQESIESSSKEMATADINVSGRRVISNDKKQELYTALDPFSADKTHVTVMYSMASYNGKSRLVEIKAVEKNYPMYGTMTLKGQLKPETIHTGANTYLYPELIDQLGINIGDSVKLGAKSFKVIGTIDQDAGVAWAGAAVAPRVYIDRSQIDQTALIKKGSSVWTNFLFKLKDDSMSKEAIKVAESIMTDKGINVRGHLDSGERSGRLIKYLNDYLGLVTLAAFFLAAIGAAFLFRSYMNSKLGNTATLISLGLSPLSAFWVSIVEIIILSLCAAIFSSLLSAGLLPILPKILNEFFPISISLSIGMKSVIASFALALFGSLAVCIPIIFATRSIKPAILFQEARHYSLKMKLSDRLLYIPGLIIFLGISIWQANSIIVGSLFFSLFIFGAILLYVLASALLSFLEKLSERSSFSSKHAILYMSRQKFASIACFLAIALGTLLTSLIPSLRESINNEVMGGYGDEKPSLFMFDIQDEQASGLQEKFQSLKVENGLISPMVRADLVTINGEKFEKKEKEEGFETREEERSRRFSNRTMNLTYRDTLDSSETITDGSYWEKPWNEDSGELPQISVETRFADRLEIKLNDVLEFDILGVSVKGVVTSIRKIKWTSFQPNFFIQFQPGVLTYAPKTFLATIKGDISAVDKSKIQTEIVSSFPNISIIDVTRLITRIADIVTKMSWALSFMAILCLLAGFIVLYSICRQQINSRFWDITMFKVLGTDFKVIQNIFVKEFFFISLSASTLGSIVSMAVSFVLSKYIFDGVYVLNLLIPIFIVLCVTGVSTAVAYQASRSVLKIRSNEFLR